MLVLFDIDGVLADCSHRLHYLKDKNYDAFYSRKEMLNDKPIQSGIDLYNYFEDSPFNEIMLVTGRPYRTLETTKEWLKKNGVNNGIILMRKDKDYRPSGEVKVQRIKDLLGCDYYKDFYPEGLKELTIFIDDDPDNVRAVEKEFPEITGLVFGSKRL